MNELTRRQFIINATLSTLLKASTSLVQTTWDLTHG